MDIETFFSTVNKNGPCTDTGKTRCWIWTKTKPGKLGYCRVRIGGKKTLAHRLAYEIVNGELTKEKPCVLHKCDNPSCVRPDHLFAGTISDNNADKVRKLRQSRGKAHSFPGSTHPASHLIESQVLEIRVRCSNGERQKDLSFQFGISKQAINDIVRGRRWLHVGGPIHNSRIRVLNETPRNER